MILQYRRYRLWPKAKGVLVSSFPAGRSRTSVPAALKVSGFQTATSIVFVLETCGYRLGSRGKGTAQILRNYHGRPCAGAVKETPLQNILPVHRPGTNLHSHHLAKPPAFLSSQEQKKKKNGRMMRLINSNNEKYKTLSPADASTSTPGCKNKSPSLLQLQNNSWSGGK